MKTPCVIGILCFFFSLHPTGMSAQDYRVGYRGQWVNWTNFNFSDNFYNQWGSRYVPSLSAGYSLNENWEADLLASANIYGTLTVADWKFEDEGRLRPYRLWMRLSSNQFELRAGLQKISFGSSSMLRPLMWFDQIDPRDPLQLTDGVYGVLARYYFLNNVNIWVWGLYGNTENRGWDTSPSDKDIPEFGGRMQSPAGPGELGLSFHHRKTASDSILTINQDSYVSIPAYTQDRLALDGKWDVGAGLWFENVLERNRDSEWVKPWVYQLSLGTDYTFALGNGLSVTVEHLLWSMSEKLFRNPENNHFSALNLTYPTGFGDMLAGMVYYNWTGREWYRLISWKREFNFLTIHILAYWNPEDRFSLYPNSAETNLFSGKGIQFMLEINH